MLFPNSEAFPRSLSLLLLSNFIPLRHENILCMIEIIFLTFLRFVLGLRILINVLHIIEKKGILSGQPPRIPVLFME